MASKLSIDDVVNEFRDSIIQSEEEVRSKFIVPLLTALGYPSSLRAEEFPVYSFDGRNPLPTKHADFILFTERDFSLHRKFKREDIDWICEHSLLVVEAKNTGEVPDINGQPQFYTIWTKAVAYLVTDGIIIRGYYYNNINSDPEIINCNVDDLPSHEEIYSFSYENIRRIKNASSNWFELIEQFAYIPENGDVIQKPSYITDEDLENFPPATFDFMRRALGNNSEGLSKVHVMTRFLNTADTIMQYSGSTGSFEIDPCLLRENYKARLYIDNDVFPVELGDFTECFLNDKSQCIFEGRYIEIGLLLKKNKLFHFEIGFHIFDSQVDSRIQGFNITRKVFNANSVRLEIDDPSHRSFVMKTKKPGKMWNSKDRMISWCNACYNDMLRLKTIENYYGIEFKLSYLGEEDKIADLRNTIDMVYNGISHSENCVILLHGGGAEDIDVDEAIVFEEKESLPLPEKTIFGVHFIPYKSWILPNDIKLKGTVTTDVIKVPGCCTYRVLDD